MVIEILTAEAGAGMCSGVVAPAEDAGLGDVVRQEVAEPMDTAA
jgi:hypothetical protein